MNENDQAVDFNNEEDLEVEEGRTEDKSQDDSKEKSEEKPKETPEARVARLKRQLEREERKLGKAPEKTEPKSEKATKPSELGYAEKAYLVANGVKGAEETKLVEEFMANTGKTLDEIVESKFFQAELKDLRDSKASSEAVPKGSKRATASSKDSVDYWLAKGELPENTPDNQELRRQVVNARYNRETASSKFSTNSTGNVMRQSQLRK